MNSVNLDIKSVVVDCVTRPLKASWTRKIISDIEAFSHIDINKILEKEIKRQTRKDKINKIFKW